MARPIVLSLLLLILVTSVTVHSQELNTDRKRLLLQLSSTFYHVLRQGQVDLDSALMYASHSLSISRLALIDLNEDDFLADAPKTDGNDDFQHSYKLLNQSKGARHIQLLNLIGALFVFQPGSRLGDSDSARLYLQKGQSEAAAARDANELCINLCYLGKYYFDKGESQAGDSCFRMAVSYCQKNGKNLNEARAWDFWALYSPFPSYPLDKRINYFENALKLYRQLNEQEAEINVLTNLSYLQFAAGRLSESMTAIKEAFELEKKINFPYSHYTTDMISLIYGAQGDDANYLSYALQSIRSVEATKDSFAYAHFCSRVAEGYDEMGGKSNEALEWYLKSVAEYKKKADQQMHLELMNANNMMIALGKDSEAVALTQSLLRQYPPVNPLDKQYHFLALGDGYFNLKEYSLADKYYKEAEKLQKEVERVSGNTWNRYVYYKVGHYYFTIKQFEKSKRCFMEVLNATSPTGVMPGGLAEIHKALYTIDSAAGRITEAMDHLKIYADLREAIYTEKQSKEIERLKIQFETEKKDNDIKLLQQKDELQKSQIKQTRLTNNIVIGSIVVLALLLVLLYNRYRINQRHSKQLEVKQREINDKNATLENLVEEKDGLLIEKEWLVKEIHHRVKNNLQMVISLLNTQSDFLNNPSAIDAIRESRERMQAIAIIHQKLYQAGNSAEINMRSYIDELVDNIKNSVGNTDRIYFQLNIADINLDISQSVPLGLILNEAVTNAIKYAYPKNERGNIEVSLQRTGDQQLQLRIADHGKGLPDGTDAAQSNSLGLQLIKLFSEQLEGDLYFINNKGLEIMLNFKRSEYISSVPEKVIA